MEQQQDEFMLDLLKQLQEIQAENMLSRKLHTDIEVRQNVNYLVLQMMIFDDTKKVIVEKDKFGFEVFSFFSDSQKAVQKKEVGKHQKDNQENQRL